MARKKLTGKIDVGLLTNRPGTRKPRVTAEQRENYLRLVAETGVFGRTAMSVGVSPREMLALRKADPLFGQQVEEAYDLYRENLQLTVKNRAVEGWLEPVFYLGRVVGNVRKFSDTLLKLEIQRHIKEYRDHQTVDMNTNSGVLVVGGGGGYDDEAEWAEAAGTKYEEGEREQ